MFGYIQKSLERHVVTQHYPKQGTENSFQGGCQSLTDSGFGARFSPHFGKYIPKNAQLSTFEGRSRNVGQQSDLSTWAAANCSPHSRKLLRRSIGKSRARTFSAG